MLYIALQFVVLVFFIPIRTIYEYFRVHNLKLMCKYVADQIYLTMLTLLFGILFGFMIYCSVLELGFGRTSSEDLI